MAQTTPKDKLRISPEEARQLFFYDSEDGVLRWRNDGPRGRRSGDVAGTKITNQGYPYVTVNGRLTLVHRIIWAVVYGRWPDSQIDHVNGITTDNRIENLREATPAQNMQNKRKYRNSTSRFVGVYYDARDKRWRAEIRVNGRRHHLGSFRYEESARDAYVNAKALKHEFQPRVRSNAEGSAP